MIKVPDRSQAVALRYFFMSLSELKRSAISGIIIIEDRL